MSQFDLSSIGQLFDRTVEPKEMADILDNTMFEYASFALMSSEAPREKIAADLFYIKLLRDAISKITPQ